MPLPWRGVRAFDSAGAGLAAGSCASGTSTGGRHVGAAVPVPGGRGGGGHPGSGRLTASVGAIVVVVVGGGGATVDGATVELGAGAWPRSAVERGPVLRMAMAPRATAATRTTAASDAARPTASRGLPGKLR
ncbi:MAG: hypothetical protein AVDCRST_MAG10-3611 [uncultured Acidimicrobiales bacterium]|uniref:Uncharacterized protein n=1 Tax=uncultured Acidimicrobiales bacterium TaxID=310071 RepID=A0A6J4JG62_9ACTN|nr:MAG: hypothetical protein AVDCRST_MAG10-3611 [uncultured Acidimicrobiales bacterium]